MLAAIRKVSISPCATGPKITIYSAMRSAGVCFELKAAVGAAFLSLEDEERFFVRLGLGFGVC